MKLLLLRHAIAEERLGSATSGEADRLRPLTEDGARKMRQGARGIARLLPELALVVTSPAVRCRATAELVAAQYSRKLVLRELGELAPDGDSTGVVEFLHAQRALPAVACVGHEPNLSQLAALLLVGKERSFLELRKGGACLLDFAGRVAPGAALLLWHLAPGQLRALR